MGSDEPHLQENHDWCVVATNDKKLPYEGKFCLKKQYSGLMEPVPSLLKNYPAFDPEKVPPNLKNQSLCLE